MCLASCGSNSEGHATIDLLKIPPIIDLWLINNELPAWLGNLAWPNGVFSRSHHRQNRHAEKQEYPSHNCARCAGFHVLPHARTALVDRFSTNYSLLLPAIDAAFFWTSREELAEASPHSVERSKLEFRTAHQRAGATTSGQVC
jgi:hypothetical protein